MSDQISETEKALRREAFGDQYRSVSKLTREEIAIQIQQINTQLAERELANRLDKVRIAASLQRFDELNDEAKSKGFAEYKVPKSHDIVKSEKKNGTPKVSSPKVSPEDKPIIDMYRQLKNVESVVGLMKQFVPEAQIRAAIKLYDSAK